MKNSKKIQKEFYVRANEILINLGFKNVDKGELYEKKINTKIGFFYARVDDDNSIMFTVYANFLEKPNEAQNYFRHWKNNIHTTSPLEIALKEVEAFYTSILNTVKLCENDQEN